MDVSRFGAGFRRWLRGRMHAFEEKKEGDLWEGGDGVG